MTDVTNALEAVGALLGERSKFEGWIAALASKSDVPSHVLEKVRADYTGRLRTVLQAFTAHTPALESALAEHQARDASLAAQEKACRDEHAEGELRHMVGEYDSAQWDQVRIGHEALLARLASERQGIAADLANVQRSLAGTAEAAQRLRALGGDVAPTAFAPRDESPTPAILAAMQDAAPVAAAISEPASVASNPNAYRVTPAAPPPELMDRRAQLDDLGFLRSSPRPTQQENGVDYQTAPTAVASRPAEAPILRIVPDAAVASAPAPIAVPFANDAAKTLRCAECGTMNYPTEWYCERCGGELAVI